MTVGKGFAFLVNSAFETKRWWFQSVALQMLAAWSLHHSSMCSVCSMHCYSFSLVRGFCKVAKGMLWCQHTCPGCHKLQPGATWNFTQGENHKSKMQGPAEAWQCAWKPTHTEQPGRTPLCSDYNLWPNSYDWKVYIYVAARISCSNPHGQVEHKQLEQMSRYMH